MSDKTECLIQIRTNKTDCEKEVLLVKASAITSIHLFDYKGDGDDVFWFVSINDGEFVAYNGKYKVEALRILDSIVCQLKDKAGLTIWELDREKVGDAE